MKFFIKIAFIILAVAFLGYSIIPAKDFPSPPVGAKQSFEPADTETRLRRAYFVNLTRAEIVSHYEREFGWLPTLRLNYPPEEAQTIIRDQTKSSYLEELVHPFRESIYINGFEPKEDKDVILIEGVVYDQKITIRYVPSSIMLRMAYVLAVSIISYVLATRVIALGSGVIRFGLKKIRK